MVTNYPASIDTNINLPLTIDGVTSVNANLLNGLRGAIIAIEQALGVNPAGIYGTVVARLLTIEANQSNLQTITLTQDLGGIPSAPLVVGLQGRPLSNAMPQTGYVLTWNGLTWLPQPASSLSVTLSGDTSGPALSNTVIAIQGNSISATTPTTNQVLEWNGTKWTPTTLPTIPSSLPPNGAAGGDLSGSYPNPGVATSGGHPIITTATAAGGDISGTYPNPTVTGLEGKVLPALADGYLNYNGTSWQFSSIGSGGIAGGDLSGAYPNPVVMNIHGASVPVAGSLTIGNILQVSGTSSLSYSALNLAGGNNFVTGLLPSTNQAPQTLNGDVVGVSNANTISSITGSFGSVQITATIEGGFSGSGTPVSYGIANIVMPSDANLTLSVTQLNQPILRVTSTPTLTATRSIILPAVSGAKYDVFNNTTGTQSLLFIASIGTGVTIPHGIKASIYFDGTNYVPGGIVIGGDLSAINNTAQTVIGLDGYKINQSITPINGQALVYNSADGLLEWQALAAQTLGPTLLFTSLASQSPTFLPKESIPVDGYSASGDGGGGPFIWNSTDTRAANGGTIVQVVGITTGRWNRVYNGHFNVKWFGAKGDGVTNDANAIISCWAAIVANGGGTCFFPASSSYYVSHVSLNLPYQVNLTGEGSYGNCAIYFTNNTDGVICAGIIGGYNVGPYIEHMGFLGSGAGSGVGLTLSNLQNVRVDHCGFLYWNKQGVLFLDTLLSEMKFCTVQLCGSQGGGFNGGDGYAAVEVDSQALGAGFTCWTWLNNNVTNNTNAAAGLRIDRGGPSTIIGGTSEGSKGPLIQIGSKTETVKGVGICYISGLDLEEYSVSSGSDHFIDIGYGLSGTSKALCIQIDNCTILTDDAVNSMTYGIKVKNCNGFKSDCNDIIVGNAFETTTLAYYWFEGLTCSNMVLGASQTYNNGYIPVVAVNSVPDLSATYSNGWTYSSQAIGGGTFSGSEIILPTPIYTPATPTTGYVSYTDIVDGYYKVKAYTGGVTIIGNPSPFSALSLPFLAGWWEGSYGIAISTGVSSWLDKSGNGNTLVQGTGANQPAFSSNTAPNSNPCLVLNGTTDFMNTASFSSALSQPFSIWVVAKYTSSGTSGTLLDGLTVNTARMARISNTSWITYSGTGPDTFGYNGGVSTAWHSYGAYYNAGAGSFGWIDSGALQIINFLGSGIMSGLTIGNAVGTDYAAASIAEIIICSREFSAADISSLNSYRVAKYGF